MSVIAVVQFGFAMMPRFVLMSAPLISGTTSGTSGSMRNALELSTTTAPACVAKGADVTGARALGKWWNARAAALGSDARSRHICAVRIYVHVPSQTLDLLDDSGALLRRYACSTSRFGLGCEPGSHCTPTGKFRV